MNLTLSPEQEKLVDELRKSGRYPDRIGTGGRTPGS